MSTVENLVSNLADAVSPVAEAYVDMVSSVSEALNEAFAPIFARKKPRETGRELAKIAAENRLTVAERHPVRATTSHYGDDIVVEYDAGDGFEAFKTYSKDALDSGGEV